jgi:hypothetical protein
LRSLSIAEVYSSQKGRRTGQMSIALRLPLTIIVMQYFICNSATLHMIADLCSFTVTTLLAPELPTKAVLMTAYLGSYTEKFTDRVTAEVCSFQL